MKKIILVLSVASLLLFTACSKDGDVSRFSNYDEFETAKSNLKNGEYSIEKTEQVELDDIYEIKADVVFADVKVVKENRDNIEIQYFGILNSSKEPSYKISKNGTLKFEVNWNNSIINLNPFVNGRGMMFIRIPNDYDGDLIIKTVSGDIFTDEFMLNDVDLSSVSGDISITELEAEELKLDNVSGDILVKGLQSDSLKASSVSGDMDFSLEKMNGDIKIDNVSGEVNITIKGDINADLNVESLSGNINCKYELDDIKKKTDNKLIGEIGSGKNDLDIETLSGDINID